MKIDKSILKSIYPNHRKITHEHIDNLGIECNYANDYSIADIYKFLNNFWSKLSDEQKASLFLNHLVEYNETINDLKNDIRSIQDRLDNLKITYSY